MGKGRDKRKRAKAKKEAQQRASSASFMPKLSRGLLVTDWPMDSQVLSHEDEEAGCQTDL